MSDKYAEMATDWLNLWDPKRLLGIMSQSNLISLLRRVAAQAKAEQKEADAQKAKGYSTALDVSDICEEIAAAILDEQDQA